jgi:cytochrome c553
MAGKLWIAFVVAVAAQAQAAPPSFERDVAPILRERCAGCHGAKAPAAELSLTTEQSVLRGGKSGPAVVPGKPADSLLLTMVANGNMPKVGPKLTSDQIETIRRWVEAGGTAKGGGSLEPPPPHVAEREVVMSILGAKCFVCHGRSKQTAGLDLRTRASILKGGKSGPAIIPGKPDDSLLVKMIASQQMPPPKLQEQYSVRGVTSDEFEKLKRWIAEDAPADEEAAAQVDPDNDPLVTAKDRQFWSFRPPVRPVAPEVRAADRVRTPIDAFVLQKLEAKGLTFSPEAGKLALMRRAYLDLTGLPPSPDEIKTYLADTRADCYERLVDRLLASPHYGERWARYWLDAAGYADSEGGVSADSIRPHAYRYRDYVIRSLNSDKPYDRFLIEQIAGDELFDYLAAKEYTPEQIDYLVATGFLRTAPDSTYSTEQNLMPERFDVVANEVEVLSSAVLGLTVGCARCHNHKFDPIPQRDYYRLSAVLQSSYDPYDWRVPQFDVIGVGAKNDPARTRLLPLKLQSEQDEVARWNAPIQERIAKLENQLKEKAAPYRQKLLNERLASLPENVRKDVTVAVNTPAESRNAVQQYLIRNFEDVLKIENKDLEAHFEDFKKTAEASRKQIQTEKETLQPIPSVRALFDMGGDPTPNYLLLRGDAQRPGMRVEPGPLSVVSAGLKPYVIEKPNFQTGTSGRRLALARWLVQPDHPLTARVMVNRIWQQHFGHGLVVGPGNFGHTGQAPTNPELLDWLATEFTRQHWSIKAMQRVIMTSSVYRQSSQATAQQVEADPEDRLLSRFPLLRLDSDALRDSILKISGTLDPQAYGPPAAIDERPDGEILAKPGKEGQRRSIYVLTRRTKHLTLLDTFDQPQLSPNCLRRSQSTVSSQALEMFNSSLLRKSSEFIAGRIIDEEGENVLRQVERAYLSILARPPSQDELRTGEKMIADATGVWKQHFEHELTAEPKLTKARWMALASFCHTLLNSAEFLYVD